MDNLPFIRKLGAALCIAGIALKFGYDLLPMDLWLTPGAVVRAVPVSGGANWHEWICTALVLGGLSCLLVSVRKKRKDSDAIWSMCRHLQVTFTFRTQTLAGFEASFTNSSISILHAPLYRSTH